MAGLLGGWQDSDENFNFLEPGFHKSISEQYQDWSLFGGADVKKLIDNQDGARDQFGQLFDSADRSARYTGYFLSERNSELDAYDNFISKVQRLTNVQLENPLAGGYTNEVAQRLGMDPEAVHAATLNGGGGDPRLAETAQQVFQDKLAELRRQNRDVATDLSFNLGDQARGLALRAQADAEAATQGPLSGTTQLGANFAGGIYGQRYNPLFLASVLAGPEGAAGKWALGRIATSALTQGAFNAGLTALEQPAVQAWRRKIGMENGVQPAIEEVGYAFLAGAIPGAVLRGGHEAVAAARPGIARILAGRAAPSEVRSVLEAVDKPAAERLAGDIGQAEQTLEADTVIGADRPAGVSQAEHDAAVAQAIRKAQDDALPPPEPPVRVRDAEAGIPSDRIAFKPAIGEAFDLDGKPVSYAQFDPGNLGTDAAAFQYKSGGDAAGVTDRLKSVKKWDPTASSKVMVFERADGSQVIADGHQRLGLAQRLMDDAQGPMPVLDGFLFKESDGWKPEDVRALAAKKNMQEGSGTPLDAARMLRDRPDLLDASLPISSPSMKQAIGLSRLSDDGFGMVINGAVPENYAAAVGQLAPDPLTHAAILQDLARAAPQTEREARFLIGDALAAGFHVEEQINLFGAGELTRTLLGERASVMSAAIKTLNADKKLFGTLADRADIIEAAGNTLARGTNEERAKSAALVGDLVMRLAQRTGPVSDLLNAAARRVAEGDVKPGAAAKEFLKDVRKALDENGLAGLMAEPRLAPPKAIEPDAPALDAEAAPAERAVEVEDEGTPDLFDALPVSTREDGSDMSVTTVKQALDEADRVGFTADVVELCTKL